MMSKMNLPNKLTLLRLCLVPVIMVLLLLPDSLVPWEIAYGVGVVIFAVTALTDMLDGKIARKYNLITNFGKFMDPVADKFMVIGTLMAMLFRMLRPDLYGLSYNNVFTVVFFVAVVAIIFRELAITSLRLVLVNSTGTVVAAKMLGKIKTVSQIFCICALMVEPLIDKLITHLAGDWFAAGVYPLSWALIAVMLVFTLLSGFDYIKGAWGSISTDW